MEISRDCQSKAFCILVIAAFTVCLILGKTLETRIQLPRNLWKKALAVDRPNLSPNSTDVLHENIITRERNYSLKSFKLPWHNSKSLESIVKQSWLQELKTFLTHSTPDHPIVLISGDLDFKKAVVNWLIAATVRQDPPIKNILVTTYSPPFCDFLNSKKYPCKCLVVPPETLTDKSMYHHKSWLINFYKLLIARVVVLRMISYWGYDVANFDSDAIILKNPIPLYYSKEYADNNIVGTHGGNLPHALRRKWGVVSCMGCIFIRSGKKTEALWKEFEEVDEFDDQVKFNYGLEKAGIQWTNRSMNNTNSNDTLSFQWEGKTADGLKITLLPQRMACREYGCTPEVRSSVYVWHRGLSDHKGGTSKERSLTNNVWFYDR